MFSSAATVVTAGVKVIKYCVTKHGKKPEDVEAAVNETAEELKNLRAALARETTERENLQAWVTELNGRLDQQRRGGQTQPQQSPEARRRRAYVTEGDPSDGPILYVESL